MQVGRNDTCPCASGKKFKKCCLGKDAKTGDLLWRQLGSIHDEMAGRLLKHGILMYGDLAIEEAWDEFWLWENKVSFDEAYETERHKAQQLFLPFFLYNWIPDEDTDLDVSTATGMAIAADYLEKLVGYLTELERRFLTESLERPFSFYDVLEVEPGTGFILKDIFVGTEVRVTERMGSRSVRTGDIVYGKVIQIDHVGMLCGMGWIMIPPIQKQLVLNLRKSIREHCCQDGADITVETLHDYGIELRELFLDIESAVSAPPRFCNTDGEEISHHRITYSIDSPQAAFDKLKNLALIQDEEELLQDAEFEPNGTLIKAKITWHKRGNSIHSTWDNTVMGRFLIDGQTLTIEVNSKNRAQHAKNEVENRLKESATHKSTVLQSVESMMREREENPDPEEDAKRKREQRELMNRPEIKEQLCKMMEAHWEKWYDEKIPALGNKTPLQAAKTADGREMLEAILIDYEQRNDAQSDQPYRPDYGQMRDRLGLKTARKETTTHEIQ